MPTGLVKRKWCRKFVIIHHETCIKSQVFRSIINSSRFSYGINMIKVMSLVLNIMVMIHNVVRSIITIRNNKIYIKVIVIIKDLTTKLEM